MNSFNPDEINSAILDKRISHKQIHELMFALSSSMGNPVYNNKTVFVQVLSIAKGVNAL